MTKQQQNFYIGETDDDDDDQQTQTKNESSKKMINVRNKNKLKNDQMQLITSLLYYLGRLGLSNDLNADYRSVVPRLNNGTTSILS